jgi:FkbM family methyltransferase
VPGWFPLVAERVHRRLRLEPEAEISLLGVRMHVDTREYTQRRYFYHCHEGSELRFLRRSLRPGDAVLDVGAHVGLFTLVAARRVGPSGQVHAFEPAPENLARLQANVLLNDFGNVVVNPVAVGAAAGTASVGLNEVGIRSGSSGAYTVGGEHGQVQVEVVALDDYVPDRLRDRRVRLMKIDAEGQEPEVIEGFAGTLDRSPPDFVMLELNSLTLDERGHSAAKLLDRLASAGYELGRPTMLGRLAPLPSRERLEQAVASAKRVQASPGSLREGLSQRDTLFNVIGVRRNTVPH